MSIKNRLQDLAVRHPFAAWGVPGLILWLVFQFIWELVKDAFFGWINQQLGKESDALTAPIETAWPTLLTFGPPMLLAVFALGIARYVYKLGFAAGAYDRGRKTAERLQEAQQGAGKGLLDFLVESAEALHGAGDWDPRIEY